VNSAWNINSFSGGSNTGVKDYQKKRVKMSGQCLSTRWRSNMETVTRILEYEALVKREKNEMSLLHVSARTNLNDIQALI